MNSQDNPLQDLPNYNPGHPGNGRPTIALLTHGAGDPNSRTIWAGVASVAQEQDVNLICVPGKPLHSPREFEAQSNVLYDLVDAQTVNALVIWMAALTHRAEIEEIRSFCQRYHPLPITTIGVLVPGIPGVTVDNYHGMRDVVMHLVEAHGRKRIAFICGPEHHQEAQARYRAFVDVLNEHRLPVDPAQVVGGNFKESDGAQAVETLLDDRRVDFDALIAASDNMAIGAMKALQARGVRLPQDLAIAALNDEPQSRVVTPPLTTGPLRFYEQARQATGMVLALLRGEPVRDHVILPTRLLVRQSCGCPDPIVTQAAAEHRGAGDSGQSFDAQRSVILARLREKVETSGALIDSNAAEQVLDAFLAEMIGGASGRFLSTVDHALHTSAIAGDALSRWHEVVSELRNGFWLCLRTEGDLFRAENLWQQARVLIGETAQRLQAYEVLKVEQQTQMLGKINQTLSAAIDLDELAEVLVRALPQIGIPSFYLSLYERSDKPSEWARLIAACDSDGQIELEAGGQRFPARQLAPVELWPENRRSSWVVEPLYFRQDQLGFILFEADPQQEEVYEILSGELSGALKRALLAAHNVELYQKAVQARRIAEEGRRLAEQANELKSRFLATVSHELRTPLSLIVGTIELMLQQDAQDAHGLSESSYRDLKSIRASAQHLARLIGDVLDLTSSQAGELRLAYELLNLQEVLAEAILLGEPLARQKGLTWRTELSSSLPFVWGDRTRLRQIVLNLISNAIKFTQRGEVKLSVEIEAGVATIRVSDTGIGIPVEEQAAIFDEFRQSERTTQRGYGGMGLGLAISKRLVELHGGYIGVDSTGEEGAGSTFYFTLPAMDRPLIQDNHMTVRSQTVLLLTQRTGDAEPMRAHLIRRGFQVETLAIEGQTDWLNRVLATAPGAVVLDTPAFEQGWKLIARFKQDPATQDVPVVFYSLSEAQDRGSLLELEWMTKPVASEGLVQALERQGIAREEVPGERIILIVDDEPEVLDLHTRIVRSLVPACRVLQARNGRQALELMARERPNLVLLDLMMPELDGFAVLERMRERKWTRETPVIVLTAQTLTAPDMVRLQQGVAAVLGKRLFSAQEVLAQVEAALSRSKHLRGDAQRVARQVMAIIHEHYAEPLTRQELAQRVGVSERHLNRCFHQEVGVPTMTYLNRYRVRQARTLLERGHSITEVALAVGFSDSSYFGRVFRQEIGVSPSAYQRGQRSPLA